MAFGKDIGGDIGQRNDHQYGGDQRDAQPAHTLTDEAFFTLLFQALPHKEAAQEKHQRHEINILERDQEIESCPALPVDDRCGGKDVCLWMKRGKRAVGKRRMMCNHQQRDKGAEMIDPGVAR